MTREAYESLVQRQLPAVLPDPAIEVCSWGRWRVGYQRVRMLPANSSEAVEEMAARIVNESCAMVTGRTH